MPRRSFTEEKAVEKIAEEIELYEPGKRPGGLCFLLGAGASYSCGIPLGGEIANHLTKKYDKDNEWGKRAPSMSDYEWAMSHFSAEEQLEMIRGFIEKARAQDTQWKLNHCYLVLSEIWKNYTKIPRILMTTNFDPLFFYAMLEQNIEPKLIRYPSDVGYMKPFETQLFPSIVHLHGYWQNHLILNQVEQWSKFLRRWSKPLAIGLKGYTFVVLGYAGSEDDVVMKLFEKLESDDQIGQILWCHNETLPTEVEERLSQFKTLNTVKIDGADPFMLEVGKKLGLAEIKTIAALDNVFKEDADKRFHPGFVAIFYSHAEITAKASNDIKKYELTITTSKDYRKPGENYAGIEIVPVDRLYDLSLFKHVLLEYDVEIEGDLAGNNANFEFKLQSKDAAYIAPVYIKPNEQTVVQLEEFKANGVDLKRVERIVIAANCERIGVGSRLTLCLKKILFK